MKRLFVKHLNHKTGASIRNLTPGKRSSLFLGRASRLSCKAQYRAGGK